MLGSSLLQNFAVQFHPSFGDKQSELHMYKSKSAMIGTAAIRTSSTDGATMLPVLLVFLVITLCLAAFSYVCFRCIRKSKDQKSKALGNAEVNGSLLEPGEGNPEDNEH